MVRSRKSAVCSFDCAKSRSEVDRIVGTMELNGVDLLDGDQATGLCFQVGIDTSGDDRLTISMAPSSANALGIGA